MILCFCYFKIWVELIQLHTLKPSTIYVLIITILLYLIQPLSLNIMITMMTCQKVWLLTAFVITVPEEMQMEMQPFANQ